MKNVLRKAHSKVVSLSSLLFYTCSPRRWLSSIGGYAEYLTCSMKRTAFLSTVCFRKNSVFFYCFCTKSYKIVGIQQQNGNINQYLFVTTACQFVGFSWIMICFFSLADLFYIRCGIFCLTNCCAVIFSRDIFLWLVFISLTVVFYIGSFDFLFLI